MPPCPHCPTQGLTGQTGRNCWGINDRGSGFFFVNDIAKSSRPQRVHRPGSARFLLLPSPSGRLKWVRAPARKRGLANGKPNARLPHPWVGKTAFPAVQVLAACRSPHCEEMVWLFLHFFRPSISPSSAGQIAPGLWYKPVADGNQGNGPAPGTRPPHAPVPLRRGYGCHPVSREAHRSAQGEVGDASVFPIAEEQSRFLCIAYQNLTGQGVSGKRFRLQNLPQIFVCFGKFPLEFLKLPV